MFKNILYDCGPINDVLQLLLSTCGWVFHFAKHPYGKLPCAGGKFHLEIKISIYREGPAILHRINSSFRASPGVLSMQSCTVNFDEEM
jgi:hypothetical protein